MSRQKILFISPHYPPSNLAAVHRSRLFAQHLPEFGWEPIILTVHEDFYEENLDWNIEKLIPINQRIEKVSAYHISKPRLIGDIGLRAFPQLYRKAKEIILTEKIDFLYIPIPSFYCSLLGRFLNFTTGIKYGIDYIDPWVHHFPGSDKVFSRHWFSTKIARFLEPIAVKKASLITGVAEGYYEGVFKRNPDLKKTAVFGAMPYGGEKDDHYAVKKLLLEPYLFSKNGKVQFVYAGAMLPKAYGPLEAIFQSISSNKEQSANIEFHFIGTGKTPNDLQGYNIKPLAEKYNLWHTVVFEYPKRIPYLDVLIHLDAADAVFILGSTEPHYTPSKTYQAVLSKKQILAVLHEQCTAVDIIQLTNAGKVLSFSGETDLQKIKNEFVVFLKEFLLSSSSYDPAKVDTVLFNKYSAKEVTHDLVLLLDKVIASK